MTAKRSETPGETIKDLHSQMAGMTRLKTSDSVNGTGDRQLVQ